MSPVHDPAKIAVATATTGAGGHIGFGVIHDIDAGASVVTSRLRVPSGGDAGLEAAFRDRMGAVDNWHGFLVHRCEVVGT
jgi:hypothetical protein